MFQEARVALAWCRGFPADSTSSELDAELKTLPEPDLEPVSPFRLAKDMRECLSLSLVFRPNALHFII